LAAEDSASSGFAFFAALRFIFVAKTPRRREDLQEFIEL
jgi:hypothetical protein